MLTPCWLLALTARGCHDEGAAPRTLVHGQGVDGPWGFDVLRVQRDPHVHDHGGIGQTEGG